jgi:hypothetical protein
MGTEKVILEVLEGGPGGGNWKALHLWNDIGQSIVSAPSGGGREYSDRIGRNYKKGGKLQILKTVESGVPAAIEFNIELPFDAAAREYLTRPVLSRKSLRLRWYCGDPSDTVNFQKVLMWPDSKSTTIGYNRNLLDDTTNIPDALRRTVGQRAPYEVELDMLGHVRLANAGVLAINKVISIGYPTDGDDCCGSNLPSDGNQDFIAVTDADGSNLPHLYWTSTSGASFTDVTLTGLTNLSALDVVKVGDYIVVGGNGVGGGTAYAKWSAIKAGTATWTRSTGVSAGTIINALVAVNSTTVYAFGNAGAILKSTDAGRTFVSIGTAVTASNFSPAAAIAVDENLIWAGASAGVLVKVQNGVASVVTVTSIGANAINSVAVPLSRGCEVYVGTADGNIRVSKDTGSTWAALAFDNVGVGAIDDMQFWGERGELLFVVQTNGSSQSRIIRDLSGGKMGSDIEIIGTFTAPANSVINSIAVSHNNHALVVGEVNAATGYIGKVSAA